MTEKFVEYRCVRCNEPIIQERDDLVGEFYYCKRCRKAINIICGLFDKVKVNLPNPDHIGMKLRHNEASMIQVYFDKEGNYEPGKTVMSKDSGGVLVRQGTFGREIRFRRSMFISNAEIDALIAMIMMLDGRIQEIRINQDIKHEKEKKNDRS